MLAKASINNMSDEVWFDQPIGCGKMRKIIFLGAIMLLSPSVLAVDCGPLKVVAIQPQKADVLIQVQGDSWTAWKSLGLHSEISTPSFQSVAQQALVAGNSILLRYTDGYDCSSNDYGKTQMIRIIK